jgi:hypothetical protein
MGAKNLFADLEFVTSCFCALADANFGKGLPYFKFEFLHDFLYTFGFFDDFLVYLLDMCSFLVVFIA